MEVYTFINVAKIEVGTYLNTIDMNYSPLKNSWQSTNEILLL